MKKTTLVCVILSLIAALAVAAAFLYKRTSSGEEEILEDL